MPSVSLRARLAYSPRMQRWLPPVAMLMLVLGSACWGSNKPEPQAPDPLTAELAAVQGELRVLERKNQELTAELMTARTNARLLEVQNKALATAVQAQVAIGSAPPFRPRRREPESAKTYAVAIANAPVVGPADAKITIVMAGEYACPYCEKARATLADLRQKYGKDLRIVYRQFVVHPNTANAPAYASCAANKQRTFEAMDTLLWEKGFKPRQFDVAVTLPDGTTQPCWTTTDGCPIVLGFAKQLGLNLTRFKSDMRTCEAEVSDAQRELASSFGIGATPAFFINGRYLAGAMPIDVFSKIIDEEAGKADTRIKRGTKRAKYYQQWVLDVGEQTVPTP